MLLSGLRFQLYDNDVLSFIHFAFVLKWQVKVTQTSINFNGTVHKRSCTQCAVRSIEYLLGIFLSTYSNFNTRIWILEQCKKTYYIRKTSSFDRPLPYFALCLSISFLSATSNLYPHAKTFEWMLRFEWKPWSLPGGMANL